MSDNITREPYRNAWYKQLQDAVKKHDEDIAKMTPHLVPDVEEGDNGKILIAGEDGAFDWGQPPEELPIITEGDEGKVLKVDEGVPKWLADSDSEYLLVTITKTGNVYTADKTYTQIRSFAEAGKCVLRYSKSIFELDRIDTNFIRFRHQVSANETVYDEQPTFTRAYVKNVSRNIFEIYNDETVLLLDTRLHFSMPYIITDNEVLSDASYSIIRDGYSDVTLRFTDSNGTYVMQYEKFENNNIIYSNSVNGYKATIGTDKVVHITQIPVLPASTSADEGKVLKVNSNGSPEWGTDSDNEYLFVTVTENSGVYSADKDWNTVYEYAQKGKVAVIYNTYIYTLSRVRSTGITFERTYGIDGTVMYTENNIAHIKVASFSVTDIVIKSNGVTMSQAKATMPRYSDITGLASLTDNGYEFIKAFIGIANIKYGNISYTLSKTNSDGTEFDFVNYEEGSLIHIGSDKSVTVSQIPKLPAAPSTDGTYTLQCTVSSGVATYSWV